MASFATTTPQWQPGDVVADLYEILDVIVTGGMGLVYRVRHRSWQIDLAVKVPRPELITSPEDMRSFEAEAESWVNLGSYPHIVNCAYVRRLDGLPRIFAEWVDGGSLAEAVRERRIYAGGPTAALRRILDVSIQIAWGLDYAHRNQLVHQDIKPANVMLSSDDTVKVTDFGMAKARAAAGERRQAAGTGSLLVSLGGLTLEYCSPEQVLAVTGHQVGLTRATDVWSWAVSVLEMFAGQPPDRSGAQARDWFAQVLHAGGARRHLPPLPEALAALLRRCFAADPADRPARMSQVADELIAIYAQEVGQPYPRQPPSEAALLADGLSNHALSMLDLGYPERAEQLWTSALAVDPHHPHSVYNRGLRRWRTGQVTDTELIAELAEVAASHDHDWVDEYLLALVQLERGDTALARALLSEAARAGAPQHELTTALALAEAPSAIRPPITLTVAESAAVLAVSADGRRAVAAGAGTVRVWEPPTGTCLHTLSIQSGPVATVAISADGWRLAVVGDDGAVQMWDMTADVRWRLLTDPEARIESVGLSPDARLVVTASRNGAVVVWDAATGRRLRTLAPGLPDWDEGGVPSQIGVGSRTVARWEPRIRRVRVWDLATGYLLRSVSLTGQRFALSADGRYALACAERTSALWDLSAGQCVRTIDWSHPWQRPVAIDGTGGWALAGEATGVQLRELATGRCLRTLPGQSGAVRAVAVSADGRYGLASDPDGNLRVWRLLPVGPRSPWSHSRPRSAGELSREAELVTVALERVGRLADRQHWTAAAAELRAARAVPGYLRSRELVDRWGEIGRHGRRVGLWNAWQVHELRCLDAEPEGVLSPDGRFALSESSSTVDVWDLTTGQRMHRLRGWHGSTFSPDSRLVITTSDAVIGLGDHQARVWDLATGQLRYSLRHRDRVTAIAVSADGWLAVSNSEDGTVWVWELASGRRLRTLGPADEPLVTVAVSADSRMVLAGCRHGTVRVWELETGKRRHVLGGSVGRTNPMAVNTAGGTALLAGPPHLVFGWDLATGKGRTILRGHTDRITDLAISAGGHTGLSSSADGTLRWWDLGTGGCIHTLSGHTGGVNGLALSADGRFALSAGADRTVRVWDLQAGQCLRVLEGHTDEVASIALSADSRIALSSGRDATLRVWELDWDYEFPAGADWDEGAEPWLAAFVARNRSGRAGGPPEDFTQLREALRDAGFGWLHPDGVRARLAQAMAQTRPTRWRHLRNPWRRKAS